jgi:O-antigen/teichoic acid export membrane protein
MSSEQASRHDAHALFTTAAAAMLGFALNLIVARALGPSGKGVLDLAGASAGLFGLVLSLSLNVGLTRQIAATGHAPAGLSRSLWLWALLCGFLASTTLLLWPGAATRLGLLPIADQSLWIFFIGVSTALGIAASSLRGIVIGRGALITANRIDLIIKCLLLGTYLFVAFALASPSARHFALAALPAIALLPILLHFAQRGPVRAEPGAMRAIILATLPLHGANILHFLNQRADLFFIQAFHGSSEVGLYALAVSLAQTILLLSSALAIPLLPQVAAATDQHQAAEAAAAACRRYVFIGSSAATLLGAAAPWMLPLVFGRDFGGSLLPLLFLLPGILAFGLTNLLVSYFAGINQNLINLRISMLGLVLTVLGNFMLTRSLGATGAALASTLAYGGMAVASLIVFSRRTRISALRLLAPDQETFRSSARMLAHLRP